MFLYVCVYTYVCESFLKYIYTMEFLSWRPTLLIIIKYHLIFGNIIGNNYFGNYFGNIIFQMVSPFVRWSVFIHA